MIVLALQITVLWLQVVLLAFGARQVIKARGAAVRAGLAVVMARQAQKASEEAAGIADWERWPDAG